MIFIVRHGQTDYNKNRRIQGARIDAPLNETGIEQAKERAKAFDGIEFDAVISSPLKRAVQTAQILTENAKVKHFEINPGFIERDYGEIDGSPIEAPTFSYYYMDIEGAEDPEELYQRMLNSLKDVSKRFSGNILIVTHGGITGSYINHQTNSTGFHLVNLTTVVVDPEDCHLVDYNIDNEKIREYLE